MRTEMMNMGWLTMPPGGWLPAKNLPALIVHDVHEGKRVQTAFAAAFPEK